MRFLTIVGVLAVAVFFSCCFQETEAHGLKLLKLVKAGLILKALSPKKILLPLPIPIPIGIHKEHHHEPHHYGGGHSFGHHDISFGHSFGGHDYGHHDYGHHGYGHGPVEYKSSGWRIEGIGFGKHHHF